MESNLIVSDSIRTQMQELATKPVAFDTVAMTVWIAEAKNLMRTVLNLKSSARVIMQPDGDTYASIVQTNK